MIDTLYNMTLNTADFVKQIRQMFVDITEESKRILTDTSKTEQQVIRDGYNEKIALAKNYAEQTVSDYKARIRGINDELKELDRKEKDDDYDKKVTTLKAKIEYENDEYNRYELEKELESAQKEFEKRKTREALTDEKERLTDMIALTNEAYSAQKKLYEKLMQEELAILKERLAEEKNLVDMFKAENGINTAKTTDWLFNAFLSNLFEAANTITQPQSQQQYNYNSANSQSVTVYQTIQTPVKSPSELAAEVKEHLEKMLRYGEM